MQIDKCGDFCNSPVRGSGIIISGEIQDPFQRTIQYLLVD